MSLWQTQLASHLHPLNTYHPCPEHACSFQRGHLWLSVRLSLAAEPMHGKDPSARELAPCEHNSASVVMDGATLCSIPRGLRHEWARLPTVVFRSLTPSVGPPPLSHSTTSASSQGHFWHLNPCLRVCFGGTKVTSSVCPGKMSCLSPLGKGSRWGSSEEVSTFERGEWREETFQELGAPPRAEGGHNVPLGPHSFVGQGGSRMTTPRGKDQSLAPFILPTLEKVWGPRSLHWETLGLRAMQRCVVHVSKLRIHSRTENRLHTHTHPPTRY